MNSAAITIETLARFCAPKDDIRRVLCKPFALAGYAAASNGHIMIAAQSLATDGLPEWGHPPADKIIRAAHDASTDIGGTWRRADEIRVTSDACWRCKGRRYVTAKTCDECDGGSFLHGSHEYHCEHCDGSGEIVEPGGQDMCHSCFGSGLYACGISEFDGIGAPDVCANSIYIAAIRELPNAEIRAELIKDPHHLEKFGAGPFVFRFDSGFGVLMPMRKNGKAFEAAVVAATAGAPA